MKVSVIVPTYNGLELLLRSVPYLLASLKSISYNSEIIIVDNGSNDKTKNYVKKLQENNNRFAIYYIFLKKNFGFAKAVNEGVNRARGEFILILNNDCFLQKDTIEKMVFFLDKNKQYKATQPIIYKYSRSISDNNEIENIGHIVDLHILKAKPVINTDFFINNSKILNTPIFSHRYFYTLVATCLLIERKFFLTEGLFDNTFHSYHEDVDFFIRVAKKGYKFFPTLTASCFHIHMGTTKRMGIYKQQRDFINLIKIIIKNYPLSFFMRHFPSLFIERLRNLNGIVKNLLQ